MEDRTEAITTNQQPSSLPSSSSHLPSHQSKPSSQRSKIDTTALSNQTINSNGEVITACIFDTTVFPASPISITNSDHQFTKVSRQPSDLSCTTDMDGTSTVATSPPTSGFANGIKMENVNPIPPESQTPISSASSQPQPQSTGQKLPASMNQTPSSLNKPKTEHLKYFLSTLGAENSGSPESRVGSAKTQESFPLRQLSPGRVPAAVQALEEAHKRNSQSSPAGSLREESLAVGPNGVTSAPTGIGAPLTIAVENQNGTPSVLGPGGIQGPVINGKEEPRKQRIRFSFMSKKKRNDSTGDPSGNNLRAGDEQITAASSTPISVLSSHARYQPGRDPPMENGKDMRNLATYHRDLIVDFENRKLEGRHEHPLEGSTALRHRSHIKSMGIKQLVRSVSMTVKKSTHRFKSLILRRAKTIPNQFASAVHGHVPHLGPDPKSPKVVSYNQRLDEYRAITGSVLLTYGARVPTPPPYVPVSDVPPPLMGAAIVSSTSSSTTRGRSTTGETVTVVSNGPGTGLHLKTPSKASVQALNGNTPTTEEPVPQAQKSASVLPVEGPSSTKKETSEGPAAGFINAFRGW
ncbi:hypothetical protein AA313_de0208313 [Arthrobotrys entomopaga]|nr:hypothetical protein AA313_de0208313 [Arthrobotrys entomopaga]